MLIVNFSNSIIDFNYQYFLSKIIVPKSIKIGILRCLSSGFKLCFDNNFLFSSLLFNILFDGLEDIHSSLIRFGTTVLFFLKPFDDEKLLITQVESFFSLNGNILTFKNIKIFSPVTGFNFLDWSFKLLKNGNIYCTPSYDNYQNFLKRVKIIINNSNYGAVRFIKAK